MVRYLSLRLPAVRGAVKVRRLQESDLPEWYALEMDKELKRYIRPACPWRPYQDWAAESRFLFESDTVFALEHASTGSFAGRASIGHFLGTCDSKHRELQVVVARRFIGHGLGKDAASLLCEYGFTTLGATSIYASADPAHPRSLQLLNELDFSEVAPTTSAEGVIEARVFRLIRDQQSGNSACGA